MELGCLEKSLEIGREGLVGVKVIGLHWEGGKERLEGGSVGDGAAGNEGKGNGHQGRSQAASSPLRPVWRSGKFRG